MQSKTTPPVTGKTLSYPGMSATDSPFRVEDKLPLAGGLVEVSSLLEAASRLLSGIAEREQRDDLKGILFLIGSAGAVAESLHCGFADHPMAQGPDGYHAHASDFAAGRQ